MTFWQNLLCSLRGHDWEHDGPKSWSMTCLRCNERYHLGKMTTNLKDYE